MVGIKKDTSKSGVIPTAFIKLVEIPEDIDIVVMDIMKCTLEALSGERENALAYTIVDNIPYTENGKMDYRNLEKYRFGERLFYVIEDPITVKYFENVSQISMISIVK